MTSSIDNVKAIHKKYPVFTPDEWNDEMVEQILAVEYLTNAKNVLELGACIGRNTVVIAETIKNNKGKLVSIEPNNDNFIRLSSAIKQTGLKNINIDERAICKYNLAYKGWDSKVINDVSKIETGWHLAKTITYYDLLSIYNIEYFDTLVIDCEGAFYNILKDFPNIINGVKTIIIENDFLKKNEAEYVHHIFKDNNFINIHSCNLNWPNSPFPCEKYFWQVWEKKDN